MVQEEFIKGYFGALCRRFAPKGYEPKRMIDTLWKGTKAMVCNDGACPNRDRFWAAFAEEFGQERLQDVPEFDDFYGREFNEAAACTQPTPLADRLRQDPPGEGLSGHPGHKSALPPRGHALAHPVGGPGRGGLRAHHHV